MNFELSKEQQMAKELFRSFTVNEVKPIAQEVDELERFPVETVEKFKRYGFLGIPFPKEYGGQGADNLTYILAVEELSKACGTSGVIVSAHTSLCAAPIYQYGTEEQKKKYLVPLANGTYLGAFGLTDYIDGLIMSIGLIIVILLSVIISLLVKINQNIEKMFK